MVQFGPVPDGANKLEITGLVGAGDNEVRDLLASIGTLTGLQPVLQK